MKHKIEFKINGDRFEIKNHEKNVYFIGRTSEISDIELRTEKVLITMRNGKKIPITITSGWVVNKVKAFIKEVFPFSVDVFQEWISNHPDSGLVNDYALPEPNEP